MLLSIILPVKSLNHLLMYNFEIHDVLCVPFIDICFIFGLHQANLVLIAYASSKGSGEPAQSRQNLRCSLIQAVSQEEPSDRKPDPWHL